MVRVLLSEVLLHGLLLYGWGLGSILRRVVNIGRRQETAGDGGSLLLRVFEASTHEQETLGATGSNRKQQEVGAVYYVYTPQPLTYDIVRDAKRLVEVHQLDLGALPLQNLGHG